MRTSAFIGLSLALLALVSCGRPEAVVQTRSPEVTIALSGSENDGKRVGAAARLRVTSDQAIGPIALELSFRNADGHVVDRTEESLPFCAAGQSCWWGASFPVSGLGLPHSKDLRSVDRVDLEVKPSPAYDGSAMTHEFDVSRDPDGTIRGTVPADEGIAYVVSLANRRPRRGESVAVTPDAGRQIDLPADLLPQRENEELRGFFYELSVPSGH